MVTFLKWDCFSDVWALLRYQIQSLSVTLFQEQKTDYPTYILNNLVITYLVKLVLNYCNEIIIWFIIVINILSKWKKRKQF